MNTDLLVADLVRDEGIRLKPYRDTVGKLTIGIGRNLDDVGLTENEARLLLANDICRVALALDKALPKWRLMSEGRQRALANMAFNLGITGLLKFKFMLAAIDRGDWQEASRQALNSTWADQVGARAKRISNLILNGD